MWCRDSSEAIRVSNYGVVRNTNDGLIFSMTYSLGLLSV